MNKNKKILIVIISLVVMILAAFTILFLFHGGADQSEVIIEKNVQEK
ncbi:hypothetical protein [Psychrobacter ciconiae]|nr:hypothetical protein [Psychrobacter ciconiae]